MAIIITLATKQLNQPSKYKIQSMTAQSRGWNRSLPSSVKSERLNVWHRRSLSLYGKNKLKVEYGCQTITSCLLCSTKERQMGLEQHDFGVNYPFKVFYRHLDLYTHKLKGKPTRLSKNKFVHYIDRKYTRMMLLSGPLIAMNQEFPSD